MKEALVPERNVSLLRARGLFITLLAKLRLKPTSHLPHAVLKSRLVGGGRAYV